MIDKKLRQAIDAAMPTKRTESDIVMAELLMNSVYQTRNHPKKTTHIFVTMAFLSNRIARFEATDKGLAALARIHERTARKHRLQLLESGNIERIPGLKHTYKFANEYIEHALKNFQNYPECITGSPKPEKKEREARISLSMRTRRLIHEQYKNTCVYCGEPSEQIDHVTPVSRGGTNDLSNLVASCAACNRKKSAKLLSELGWTIDEGKDA